MDLLEYLRKSAKSQATVYTTFLQQYSRNNSSIHVFHEGRDDPSFYGNFLENRIKNKQKIHYYQAKNKNNVYYNYEKLNWSSFERSRVLFFVDKDLSDFLEVKYPQDINIFVTEYYSIENYLVTDSMLSRCNRELIGLDDEKKNKKIIKQFKLGLGTFYQAYTLVSAYIIHHRKNNSTLNLQNIVFRDMFEIDRNFIVKRKKKLLNVLDKKTGANSHFRYSTIKNIVNQINGIKNPKVHVRGKYELMYFVNCINMIPDLLNAETAVGERRYKCNVSLSISNAVTILAPRLRQPADLRLFLEKSLK